MGMAKAPSRIKIDGAEYYSLAEYARLNGLTAHGVKMRHRTGKLAGAIKHKSLNCNTAWYVPAVPAEKNDVPAGFPALNLNKWGEPGPAKVDTSKPHVNCSDCPHNREPQRRCYGLTQHYSMADGDFLYYSCHRIGRKVNPRPEWFEEIKKEEQAAMTPYKEPIGTAKPERQETDETMYKEALVRLEAQASVLEAEAEELEARFEALIDQAGKLKAAAAAITAVLEPTKGVA